MTSGYGSSFHSIPTLSHPVELSLLASHIYEVGQVLHSYGMFRQAASAYQDSLRVARRIPPPPPRQDQPSYDESSRGDGDNIGFRSSLSVQSCHRYAAANTSETSTSARRGASTAWWWSNEIQVLVVKCCLAAALRSAGELRRSLDTYREVLRAARMRSSVDAGVIGRYGPHADEQLSLLCLLGAREDEVRCLVQIGLIQRDMGRTADAIFTLSEALRVSVSMRGTEYHEDVARIMTELAHIHRVDRRSLDAALFLYRKALRICRSGAVLPLGGNGHPFVSELLEWMGVVLVERGDIEEAEHMFEELETSRWAAMHWHEDGDTGWEGSGRQCAPAA